MANQLVLVIVAAIVGLAIVVTLSLRRGRGTAVPQTDAPAKEPGTSAALRVVPTGTPAAAGPAAAIAASPQTPSTLPPIASAPTTATLPTPAPERLCAPEVFSKLFELALGKGRPPSTISKAHTEFVDAIAKALEDGAAQQRYTPRRPNMLPRVLSASSDDGFSSRELATLIARDSSLVGNVLKIANSPFYRITEEPVESVDRAVVLLGVDGIRSVVTAALMQPIFRVGGSDFPRFPEITWEHTCRAASAAVPYNFLAEDSDPFVAELLCHVMGLAGIVVFRVVMDQYAANPKLRPDAGVVSQLLDKHSATLARTIGVSWELSEQTLAGLDGQEFGKTRYSTALGRSLYFGRVVGALSVLCVNRAIDRNTAKASIPATGIAPAQIDKMWEKLVPP
jgi:hypothetical protein